MGTLNLYINIITYDEKNIGQILKYNIVYVT